MAALSRLFDRLLDGLAVIAGVLTCVLTVGVAAEVFIRDLGIGAIPGAVQITEYLIYISTFFAAPWALREGAHLRVDFLVGRLEGPARHRVDVIATAVGLAVCSVLTWYGVRILSESFKAGNFVPSNLVFPEWWILWPVPLGCLCLALELLRRLYRTLSRAGQGGAAGAGTTGL